MQRYILLFFMIISIGAMAQAPVPLTELETLLSFYKSISELEVSFKQVKKIKEIKTPLHAEGRLKLKYPNDIVWEILKPSSVIVSLSAKEIKIQTGEGEFQSTQIIKTGDLGQGKESQSLQALITWLQMDSKMLNKDYIITKLGKNEYAFVPKNLEGSPFSKLHMHLSDKKFVSKLILFEKSEDILEIIFGTPKVVLKK